MVERSDDERHQISAPPELDQPQRPRWFLSVHLRQLLGFLLLLALTILAAALIVSSLGRARVMELSQNELAQQAEMAARVLPRSPVGASEWQRTAEHLGGDPEASFPLHVSFYDDEGYPLASTSPQVPTDAGDPPTLEEVASALERGQGHALRTVDDGAGGQEMLFVAIVAPATAERGPVVVRLGRSTEAYRNTIDELTFAIIFGALLALLASVLAGLLSARLLSKPIAEMSVLAQQMAAGEPLRIDASRKDELGVLAASINYLSDQLTARIDQAYSDKMLLSTILDGMAEGVIVADTRGRVVLVNPAAIKLLGLGERHAVEGRLLEEINRPKQLSDAMDDAIVERRPINRELTLDQQDAMHLAVAAAPTREADRVTGAVAVLHDITKIRQLERVRKDFVANVSHELRTPLATITGYAETLLAGPLELEPMTRDFIETIERNGRRLTYLVQDLLILARLEAQGEGPPLGPVHLSSAVAEVLDALESAAEEQGVTLRVDLDELPPVKAEQRALTQVVRNLVENAVKYTDPSGTIWLRASQDGDGVMIKVTDTGIGIEAVHLPRIFERFYRVDEGRSRDRGGTGLGLAIVKHMVQAMDGEIGVHSRPGTGTTFTIRLPVHDDGAGQTEPTAAGEGAGVSRSPGNLRVEP